MTAQPTTELLALLHKLGAVSSERPMRMVLEPRVVFDAAGVALAADAVAESAVEAPPPPEIPSAADLQVICEFDDLAQALACQEPVTDATSIVFIDSAVSDPEILANAVQPDSEVVYLSADRDGIEQMAYYLEGRAGLGAIHILSHGEAGELQLGATAFNAATMAGEHADELAIIRAALGDDADILIYGCDVAAGTAGAEFMNALAEATGADIAASTDATGDAAQGGDWDLEARVGAVESRLIDADYWEHLLAGINDAPVLDISGTPDFGRTYAGVDLANHDGNTVAQMLRSANLYSRDPITDADWDDDAIAVVGVNDTNGTWQYSTDGGTTWTAFGAVSQTNAVLLAADANVRFVANTGYVGQDPTLDFRAWDGSTGANGDTGVDTTTNGGTTAFSTDIETAFIDVIDAANVVTVTSADNLAAGGLEAIIQAVPQDSVAYIEFDASLEGVVLTGWTLV